MHIENVLNVFTLTELSFTFVKNQLNAFPLLILAANLNTEFRISHNAQKA